MVAVLFEGQRHRRRRARRRPREPRHGHHVSDRNLPPCPQPSARGGGWLAGERAALGGVALLLRHGPRPMALQEPWRGRRTRL